jgi:hypothetical protein
MSREMEAMLKVLGPTHAASSVFQNALTKGREEYKAKKYANCAWTIRKAFDFFVQTSMRYNARRNNSNI